MKLCPALHVPIQRVELSEALHLPHTYTHETKPFTHPKESKDLGLGIPPTRTQTFENLFSVAYMKGDFPLYFMFGSAPRSSTFRQSC